MGAPVAPVKMGGTSVSLTAMVDPKAVFLSYASQDAEAVQRVRDGLQAAGIEVWFDQAELKGGDAWDAAIRKRIKDCALFVPVVSAATNARDEGYFRLEWKLAVDRSHLMAEDKAFLLPVVLEGASEPAARVPPRFREIQWSRVASEGEIAAFARHVLELLHGPAPSLVLPHAAPRTAAPQGPSIAVLPFVNMSRDEDNEYFADGLAEELLNVLANIRGLRVASRTSAFSFKGKDTPLSTIARQLGVSTVLEGSVRRAGKRVRVTAQLIEVATDSHRWSQTYDRDLDDIFAVQDDITKSVVTELRRALMGDAQAAQGDAVAAEVQAASAGRSADPEAYRLFLQGRFFSMRATQHEAALAAEYFQQAVERDPHFALGWAGLATGIWIQSAHGWVPPSEGFEKARAAAKRALELEPDLPEAHVALSRSLSVDWNWPDATAAIEKALALAPGNATVLRTAGRHFANMGCLEEGLEYTRRSLAFDPLSFAGYINLGFLCTWSGDLDGAEAAIRRAIELNPTGGISHLSLAVVHLFRGEPRKALEESQQEMIALGGLLTGIMARHSLGDRKRSDEALAELISTHGKNEAFQIAQVLAWRGEAEAAFEWLETAFKQRDLGLSQLLVDPFFKSLRADPRWLALVRRVGLPEPK
jgi:TolB-like protein/tetratricopeptide (TPR) repeat protein